MIEGCPWCDTEVEIEAELKEQDCPNCGRSIMPCSYCRDLENECDFHRNSRGLGKCQFSNWH